MKATDTFRNPAYGHNWIHIRTNDDGSMEYECKNCKNTIDRDLNASINILDEGLKLYMKEVYG